MKILLAFRRKSYQDLSVTFLTQIGVTLINIILLKLLAQLLSKEGFGAYLVIRRVISFAFPVLTLNLAVSMARNISFNREKAEAYLISSFLIIFLFSMVLLLFLPIYKDLLSKILFGNIYYANLILPMIIFLHSNSFQILCEGYFRGHHNFNKGNSVTFLFWITSLITLVVFLFSSSDVKKILYYYFLIYAIISYFINILLLILDGKFRSNIKLSAVKSFNLNIFKVERNFFNFGISRLPTGFLLSAVFFIPLLVASSSISLEVAASIGIIVSIIRMMQVVVYPFNLIFIPKFSLYKATNNKEVIYKNSKMVLEFIFTYPFLLGLFIYFLSPEVIMLWFGGKYMEVVLYLSIVGMFIGFFLSYILIRGILDGLIEYPYSNIITLSGALATGIISLMTLYFSWKLLGLSISIVVGILIMGIMSIIVLARNQNIKLINRKNVLAIIWFFLVAILLGGYSQLFVISSIVFSLMIKLLIVLLLTGLSFVVYKKLNFKWIENFSVKSA